MENSSLVRPRLEASFDVFDTSKDAHKVASARLTDQEDSECPTIRQQLRTSPAPGHEEP